MNFKFTNSLILFVVILLFLINNNFCYGEKNDEEKAEEYLQLYSNAMEEYLRANYNIKLQSRVNIEDMNLPNVFLQQSEAGKIYNASISVARAIQKLKELPYKSFTNIDLRRKIDRVLGLRISLLNAEELTKFVKLTVEDDGTGDEKYCIYDDPDSCNLNFSQMWQRFIDANSSKEIKFYWKQYVNKIENEKESYVELRDFYKKISRSYNSTKEMYFRQYEDVTIYEDIRNVLQELQPFYEQLHAYIRYVLRKKFGKDEIHVRGPIPEELFLKFIASEISPDDYPYPYKEFRVFKEHLEAKNYTARKMLEDADDFFDNMNVGRVPSSFWNSSVLLDDKLCANTILYAGSGSDIVLWYCNEVSVKNYLELHQLFASIHYKLNSGNLPYLERNVVWPGFEDAVKFATLLSVDTHHYFQKVGIWDSHVPFNKDANVNRLFVWSLILFVKIIETNFEIVYALDDLERVQPPDSCEYWEKKLSMIGLESSTDFVKDIAISKEVYKAHAKNIFEMILSFQFYEALCRKAGKFFEHQYGYLNTCDFSGSNEAGAALKKMMQMGSTRSWRDTMEQLTDDRHLRASSILRFFEPLRIRLEELNNLNNEQVGWDKKRFCD